MNEAALARGFALPALGQPDILERGHFAKQVDLDLINEFFLGDNAHETLILDGEAARLGFRLRYGVAQDWEVGLALPYYIVGGGFLDSTIETWHRWFSLPNANRDQRPHNQLDYRYERDGETLLDAHSSANGIGDLRLQAGRALLDGVVARAELKLPTGSASHLMGNRAVGAALWVDAAIPFPEDSRFGGFVSGGLSYTARGDILEDQQKTFVPFAGLGLSARLIGNFGAEAQIDVHGALYRDSELQPLHNIGAPVSFGVFYAPARSPRIDLLIQEDASVYVSPDFVLNLSLSMP
ncbi:MAG TPA: DUF3187 family protein [Nevskiaceae bacterium]|nr:DUF3187 family protein [Nevskiaceae bacterium]